MRSPESTSLKHIDPVCKMRAVPADGLAPFVYRDRTYFFCSPTCRSAFIANPDYYLHGAGSNTTTHPGELDGFR